MLLHEVVLRAGGVCLRLSYTRLPPVIGEYPNDAARGLPQLSCPTVKHDLLVAEADVAVFDIAGSDIYTPSRRGRLLCDQIAPSKKGKDCCENKLHIFHLRQRLAHNARHHPPPQETDEA